MIYAHFFNALKEVIAKEEQALRDSQVVDYHRDHVAMDDTCLDPIFNLITSAQNDYENMSEEEA
jgi:hypothetical protein